MNSTARPRSLWAVLLACMLTLSSCANPHAAASRAAASPPPATSPVSAKVIPRESPAATQYPQTTLSHGGMTLTMYLPDPALGYYRGARFDWSGIVCRVQYKGHTFFAPFKTTHDPANHDDILGTAEEFGMESPLGYGEAKPGETFMKIGVGELRRVEEPRYCFYQNYEVVRPFPWRIRKGSTWIEYTQQSPTVRGYSYLYTKRLSLLPDHAGFQISRVLRNTGVKSIDTEHYGHNFVILDDHPIGPDYQLRYAFNPSTSTAAASIAPVVLTGRTINLSGAVTDNKPVWAEIAGCNAARENAVTISHLPSGVRLDIIQDFAPSHMILYATPTAICPEAFIHLQLAPGQEKTWRTDYLLNVPSTDP